MDNILTPYITRELERGTDYLLGVLDERVIPKTKENVKKFFVLFRNSVGTDIVGASA